MKSRLIRCLIIGLSILLLASCADTGEAYSSFSLNGRTFKSLDLQDPHFYMNDDKEIAPIMSDPRCC